MSQYSILVNTCDNFEDCWDPFFKLFSTFWSDYNGTIYLNTEKKHYAFEQLNIVPLKVAKDIGEGQRLTWSECLIRALNNIDNDIVLYMQEDYFIKADVKNDLVEKYVQLMHSNINIDCIHLTDQSVISENTESIYEKLFPVVLKQRYRVSCQAALWRKDVLLELLRSYESAWEFEEFGSKRSAILKHKFYVVDKNWIKLNEFEIIPYIFTGIIQGRWYNEVVPLFLNNDIKIDYNKRGFFEDAKPKPTKLKIIHKYQKILIYFKNIPELVKLKMQN